MPRLWSSHVHHVWNGVGLLPRMPHDPADRVGRETPYDQIASFVPLMQGLAAQPLPPVVLLGGIVGRILPNLRCDFAQPLCLRAVGITVAWYCNLCNRSIPWEDERTFERDTQARLERHRQREARRSATAP